MRALFATAVAFCHLWGASAEAVSLRVAPARLDLVAPDSAATLTLRNEDTRPLNVQIRIFRWSQVDGIEHLEPTKDVVASPPFTTLAPSGDYTVRIVRVNKAPVAGEESYRLLIDELPDRTRERSGAISFILRYSIPVFFVRRDASAPQVAWSIEPSRNSLLLTAENTGERHLRVADLELADGGARLAARSGLVGYVLAGAVMRWSLPRPQGRAIWGRGISLSAEGETGAINATAAIRSGR